MLILGCFVGLELGKRVNNLVLSRPVVLGEEIPLGNVDELLAVARDFHADWPVLHLRGPNLRVRKDLLDEASGRVSLLEASVSVGTEGHVENRRVGGL